MNKNHDQLNASNTVVTLPKPAPIEIDFSTQPWREKELIAILAAMVRMSKSGAKPMEVYDD